MTTQVNAVLIGVKATLNSLHDEGQTWRAIAKTAGVSPGLVHHIAHGRFEHASWDTIRRLSLRLSRIDPGPIEYVLPCPVHGEPHVADCHGAPVAAVVTLAPGERIAKPSVPRTRQSYIRPCLPHDPEARAHRLRGLLAQAEAELNVRSAP